VLKPTLSADRVALSQLRSEYAASLDGRDAGRFSALFVPDGTLVIRFHEGEDVELTGASALRGLSTFQDPSPFLQTLHVVANAAADISGDTATGWTHCIAHHLIRRDDGVYDDVLYLRYDDEYARTGAGWRFASRLVTLCWSELVPALVRTGAASRPRWAGVEEGYPAGS
jgi:hypothetical protein